MNLPPEMLNSKHRPIETSGGRRGCARILPLNARATLKVTQDCVLHMEADADARLLVVLKVFKVLSLSIASRMEVENAVMSLDALGAPEEALVAVFITVVVLDALLTVVTRARKDLVTIV